MKISVNHLKDFVKLSPPIERIAERLTMAGLEVKKVEPAVGGKDIVFEIEITSNRPDWLSHLGVAREIAAVENLPLKMPELPAPAKRPLPSGWKIELKEREGCPYYTGVLMEGINWTPAPDFMRERLHACGLRSINLIVDITNYVLLEVGQPLHAFDADLLKGREIQIRRAKTDEPMTAIDQSSLKLKDQDLVIADHERPVALAGVMGGVNSEVSERTRNIFLESAFFNPRWVRQTSRRLGIASESSYRFERRVDPQGVDLARDRAIYLIEQYAKPRFISGVLKAGTKPVHFRGRIHLKADEIQKILGVLLRPSEIMSILTRLGLDVKTISSSGWSVGIPTFRSDLTRPVDLVEEIARIHGYERIPETLPERAPLHSFGHYPRLKLEHRAREFFSGLGFFEAVTFSLIPELGLGRETELKDAVSIINPMNKELTWMRPVMAPSLLQVVQKNVSQGAKRVPIFEIANIYRRVGKSPVEERTLAIAWYGDVRVKNWLDAQREVTFYDMKGLIESFFKNLGIAGLHFEPLHHPLLNEAGSELIRANSEALGFLGSVHPRLLKLWDLESEVYFAEISLEKLQHHVIWQKKFKDFPRFPSVERDLSLLVSEEVKAGEIRQEIHRMGQGLVRDIEVFDLFRGGRVPPGHKNVAFHVTYQSLERTLISEEIQKLHSQIAGGLAKKFQATFQSTS